MYLAMPLCGLQIRGKSPPERQAVRTRGLGCQGLSGSPHLGLWLGFKPPTNRDLIWSEDGGGGWSVAGLNFW